MPQLDLVLQQLGGLDRQEREQVFATLSESLFPGSPAGAFPSVVRNPGVCGGSARMVRTRVPVWTLERMRQLGVSEIDVLRCFPNLRAADLVQAWGYAAAHAGEIARDIAENEED